MGTLLNLNELSSMLPSPLGLCEAQPVQAAERDWQGKTRAGLGGWAAECFLSILLFPLMGLGSQAKNTPS